MQQTVKTLIPISKTFFEIKATILANEKIRKILFYDDPDALKKETPSYEQVQENVYLAPVLDIPKTEWKKHTYIMLDLLDGDIDYEDDGEKTGYFAIGITVLCDYKNWELSGNELRVYTLSDEIIKSIDNHKFSSSGKLYAATVRSAIVDKQLYGLVIKAFIDDSAEESDI